MHFRNPRRSIPSEVRQAIEGLPAQLRDVLFLRELKGLSYDEIADVTRLPLGTVMSRLLRAREHLRQSLAPNTAKTLNRAADGRDAAAESAMGVLHPLDWTNCLQKADSSYCDY